jgi:SAM-dependent methyltransferase
MKNYSKDDRLNAVFMEKATCLVCGQDNAALKGIRGNREYNGADPNAEPHIFTQVVECRNCSFIYTDPRIMGIGFLESEHYNDPEGYQSDAGDSVLDMFEHRTKFIQKFKADGELLDVGAGKGEFVFVAGRHGFKAIGVEPSPRFCEYGREKFGIEMVNGLLATSDLLSGQKYDVVTMHHVLEHVEEPLQLLNQIKDCLKIDGIAYIEVPNAASNTLRIIDAYFRLRGRRWSSRLSPMHPPFHEYGYTPRSLSLLSEKAGFEVVKMETFSLYSRKGATFSSNTIAGMTKRAAIMLLDALGNRDMLAFVLRKATN